MRIGITLTILYLLMPSYAHCQWIHYNTGNTQGIHGSLVSSGIEDKSGNLWFGTDLGVACYKPGTDTWKSYNTTYGLNNSFVYQVFEDSRGGIWIATNGGGVSRFTGDSWTTYTVSEGLPFNVVRAVSEAPGGTIWFGTYGRGICSYRPETGFRKDTTKALANCYVMCMLALSDTALLIGTLHEGLIVVRNHGIEYLDMAKGLAGTSVYSLYRDHAGIIWIGTDKGAQPYDPATAMLHACPDTLSEKPVYAICENGENPVFASSNRLYQLVKGSWSSIQPGNLESPVTFFSAFYDSNGNGWFGSSGHGLFKKNGSNWYNYFNSTGLNEYSFVSLCEDSQQNLWFASYSDLYRFDGLNWTSMAKSFGLRNIYFRQILADGEGNIWCTSDYGGLYNFNGSEWTHYPVDVYFNGSNIRRMALGPDGSLWVTSWYSGLYRYDGKAWTRFTTEQGLASNNTAAVAWYADGRMAVASDFADLSIYDGHTWTSDYTLSGYHSIVDMAVDGKGNTWLATQNGIIKYNGAGTEEFFRDPNYSWNYIPFIQADKAGHIWTCNLSSGLFHFDGNAWKNYSMNDGLSTNYLTDILFDSKNRIWLTSNYGINMSSNITGVPEIETEGREVLSAFPNPFLQRVDIQYYSVTGGSARFQFYTAEGRLLLVKEKKVEAGNNVFHFDSSGWPEGILFCTMNMNGGIRQIKLMKLTDK